MRPAAARTAASLAAALAACALTACAGELDADSVTLQTPQALACAATPDLQARLWISGSANPCALDVDLAAGTTTGSCNTRPGRKRTLTLDWFVHDDAHDIDLILAQARDTLDLSNEQNAEEAFNVSDDQVSLFGCLDVSVDQVSGSETVHIDGNDVPVCDVDNSCNGAAGDGCTNLGELCGGGDPFDANVEPP